MSNDYYEHSNIPSNNAFGAAATQRREFASIEDGFDKLPKLSGNGHKTVRVKSDASGLESVTLYESLTAETESLVAADSGRTFGLNRADGITVTLPSAAAAGAGWKAKFRVETAPTGGNYVITENTALDTNVLAGGVNELEVDTNDDGPYSSAFTQVNFIQNIAVLGDYIEIECNGANFFVVGQTNADGGITLT